MEVRGSTLVVVSAVTILLFMVGVAVVGTELRQEYRVASKGENQRTDVDLHDGRVVWVEQWGRAARVVMYDVQAPKQQTELAANASLAHPVLFDGKRVVWTDAQGRVHVRTLGAAQAEEKVLLADLWVPGRTLEGSTLLLAGAMEGEEGLWRVRLGEALAFEPVKLASAPSIVSGESVLWWDLDPRPPLVLSHGRVWWFAGRDVHAFDLDAREPLPSLGAGGRVLSLDADGDLVAWAEDRGRIRQVSYAHLANGTRGEVSAFPGDQHSPAVNGSRVLLVQRDGLVRMKDLASGAERVLPARTQDNVQLRLAPEWAAWLSGTLTGRNVVMVPLGS